MTLQPLAELLPAVVAQLAHHNPRRTPMTDQELTSRLQEVLEAAHRRWRKGQGGFGALVTPPLPAALIDQVAAGLAPVLRGLVQEAVTTRLEAPAVNRDAGGAEVRLAPTDLRPSREAG